MPRSQLFGVFTVKNVELLSLADFMFEACCNTAAEQSAGMTTGLNAHAIKRQAGWIDSARARLIAVADHPQPDMPASHPITYDREFKMPDMILVDGQALNTDAEAIATSWQLICYELMKSNSGGLGGGMSAFDADRCEQNIASVEQLVAAIASTSQTVDFPETSDPAALPGSRKK